MTDTETRFSRPVTDEALALHYDSVVVDATSFFIEGHSEQLEVGGLTALNLTVPDTEDDAGGAIIKIAELYEIARHDPKLTIAFTVDDILTAKKDGIVALIIGAQNARHRGRNSASCRPFIGWACVCRSCRTTIGVSWRTVPRQGPMLV